MLLLAGALSASERPQPVVDLPVHWVDETRQLVSARGSVKERVESIFETASIRIRWSNSGTDIAPNALAVIFLLDPPPAPSVSDHAMGAMTDGENRRFVYVYVNPVLRGCGSCGAGALPHDGRRRDFLESAFARGRARDCPLPAPRRRARGVRDHERHSDADAPPPGPTRSGREDEVPDSPRG